MVNISSHLVLIGRCVCSQHALHHLVDLAASVVNERLLLLTQRQAVPQLRVVAGETKRWQGYHGDMYIHSYFCNRENHIIYYYGNKIRG